MRSDPDYNLIGRKLRVPMDDWRLRAKCLGLDPEVFHPERGGDVAAAKAICRACPVRLECLDYAVSAREKIGIWGGMTERERRPIRRRMEQRAS